MLSRSFKQSFFLLFFPLILLGGSQIAQACSCGRNSTVLDSYEWAEVVVVVRAMSVEKASPEQTAPEGRMSNGENYVDGVKSTTMQVEHVFKGTLKVGDEMVFAQGGGADCIFTFNEKDIGKKFLFYLKRFGDSKGVIAMTSAGSRKVGPADSTVWIVGTCGRSSNVDYAGDDLLYLNNLQKARGRTRISGTVRFAAESDESVAGRKIRIVGAKKQYEVKTDENGVYELYDVPAGKYAVVPEIPKGWKVGRFWLRYSPSFAGFDETKSPNQILIGLEDKKHAGLDLRFDIDNAVRGFIHDPSGKPMKDVCVHLVPPDGTKGPYLGDCTNPNGSFEIDEIPPGSYVLVVNEDGEIDSDEPFTTFYYPNVKKREDATVFHIGVGDFIENLQIHPTVEVETIIVEGLFLYSDGKPVSDERVSFKSARSAETAGDKSDEKNDASAPTDASGRFSIKILKGAKGSLWGAMYSFVGEFENCPKLDRLIKQAGNGIPEIKTPAVEVFAETNLYDVVLKYPFPSCKKAKIE
ncbi:MAG: hypothetical protein ACT4OT_01085 [Acidobacteriota bacterium]